LDQERTYKWIQDRLRELHSGTLSEQDLARLQEMARTDPFIADAMEGFYAHPGSEHATRLHSIEQKIKQTKRERRRWLVPNLTVTAIAASVMVIVATYAVISRMQKDNEETLFVFVAPDSLTTTDSTSDSITPDIAMQEDARYSSESKEEKTESANTIPPPEKNQESIADNKASKAPPVVAEQPGQKEKVTEVQPKSTLSTQSAPAAAAPVDDDIAPQTKDLAISSKTEIARSKSDEGFYANQMNPDLMYSRVTGHVVDAATGIPLSAKILVNYSNEFIYTDARGYFEFSIPEPVAVVQVSFSGLVDSTFLVKQGEENIQVGLRTDALIPNQAMAGAKNKGPVISLRDPLIESHLLFSSYVHSNALLQLTPEPSAARRKVVIEFKVKKDGRPTDLTVIETSRDKTYDSEAVRLIKEGPEWVCFGGEYPCTRRYTFYFR
jgi:outer membrane biosynthesis protein TonB